MLFFDDRVHFVLYKNKVITRPSLWPAACWQDEDDERSFSVEHNMSYYNVLPLNIPDILDSSVNNYYKGVLVMDESAVIIFSLSIDIQSAVCCCSACLPSHLCIV